jgi:asparagine synthase (glutamine-hydrolysing)
VGVSLSGGLDSSLITALAREGRDVLDTFVVGMAGSEDIARSEEVARALGTRHHIYRYNFPEMLQVLPEVIYHLESFDAARWCATPSPTISWRGWRDSTSRSC